MASKDKSYRQLDNELQEVLDKLQSDENNVDVVLREYEKGMSIIKEIESYLKEAQNKIIKLSPTSGKRKR